MTPGERAENLASEILHCVSGAGFYNNANQAIALILTALRDERRRAMEEAAKLAEQEPDGYAVQNCCLVYGGNSFPGPMKKALQCDRGILAKAIREQARREEQPKEKKPCE